MATEDEIKARVEKVAELFEARYSSASIGISYHERNKHAIEPFVNSIMMLEQTLAAQTRARQEAESAAAQARREAATFEEAALTNEKERTHAERLLRAEIQDLRRSIALLRAAHVTNLRLYLATVEGQS